MAKWVSKLVFLSIVTNIQTTCTCEQLLWWLLYPREGERIWKPDSLELSTVALYTYIKGINCGEKTIVKGPDLEATELDNDSNNLFGKEHDLLVIGFATSCSSVMAEDSTLHDHQGALLTWEWRGRGEDSGGLTPLQEVLHLVQSTDVGRRRVHCHRFRKLHQSILCSWDPVVCESFNIYNMCWM